MKIALCSVSFVMMVFGSICFAHASGFESAQILENVGFDLPETILHDEKQDIYLVSNIAGKVPAKDDNGFISKISSDGDIIDLKWIDGASADVELHSPKGMALRGNQLFVVDIDVVRIFNRRTGAPEGKIELHGTTFLNDIVLGADKTLYVSDSALAFINGGFHATEQDGLYKIDNENKVKKWVHGSALLQPNGLELLDDGTIGVVTRGSNVFYHLNVEGKMEEEISLPGKILDGLIRDEKGRFFISSWETAKIYLVDEKGTILTFANLPVPAANIGYDKKRKKLLLPLLKENRIAFLKIE